MDDRGDAAPRLDRALGPLGVMLLVFSALSPVMSIYIGGAGVLHMAGTGAALAFLLGGVTSALVALLYAEVGAAFPRAGGTYSSIAPILGHAGAFPIVATCVLTLPANIAFTAVGFADYARVLVPDAPLVATAIASVVFATFIAALNIRTAAWVTGVFLAIEAAVVVLLTVVALAHPARSIGDVLLYPQMLEHGALQPASWTTLALATVSGAWATAGAGYALYFAEDMKDAPRKIGRAVAWAGAVAALSIALPTVLVVLAIGDLPSVLGDEAPIAAFLRAYCGPGVTKLVSIAVVAALFNCVVATVMVGSRLLFGMGRDGILSKSTNAHLAHLHPRLRSPVAATAWMGVASSLLVLLGERRLLVLISGEVAGHLLMAIAVLVGRRRGLTGVRFRTPWHPVLPVFGLIVTAAFTVADWMDADAGRPSVVLLTSLFFGAMIYYRLRLQKAATGWKVAAAIPPAIDSLASED